MRDTGIIRRVDDLGRIVIPKEIRRELGIREGDPLEIYREGTTVSFASTIPMKNLRKDLQRLKKKSPIIIKAISTKNFALSEWHLMKLNIN